MVNALRRAGFVTDTAGVQRPTHALTIYRGVRDGPWGVRVPGTARGLSWSFSLGRARHYATYYSPAPKCAGPIFRAEIPPAHVLAILLSWREEEVVVDPRHLRNLQLLSVGSAWRAHPDTPMPEAMVERAAGPIDLEAAVAEFDRVVQWEPLDRYAYWLARSDPALTSEPPRSRLPAPPWCPACAG